jgi:phosphocarrier protein HPr
MTHARETVEIVNKRGLHARASAKFVNCVSNLPDGVNVKVLKDGSEVAGASILGLMMLGAAKGEQIDILCEGDGADDALALLVTMVRDGFGEE